MLFTGYLLKLSCHCPKFYRSKPKTYTFDCFYFSFYGEDKLFI